MAVDIIISIFLYYLLIQTPKTTAVSPREDFKKNFYDCSKCPQLDKKIKRELDAFFGREASSKHNILSGNLQKYIYSKNPSSSLNYFQLKGWGARGMPFNVLYTPNIHQQKIMKSTSNQSLKEKYTKQSKPFPEIYDLVLEDEKAPRKNSKNVLKKQIIPRKYYSLIPQLFVSYGW